MCSDFWNIISTISSVVLSTVAIIISIRIANSQNKIGLFEKRFEVYEQCIAFFEHIINYWKLNDRCSITMMELANLEQQLDSNIEKAKYLFNDKASDLLKQSKEHFESIIKLYQMNDTNQSQIDEIKEKVLQCKVKFISNSIKYLNL